MNRGLEDALFARGYEVLFAIGFGERPDGSYSIKIAANPAVRQLSEKTWHVTRDTIIKALDRLMTVELDDLEIE